MKLSEMNPYVRFARIERKSLPTIRSAAIDHRIFVCLTGSGLFSVGGKLYTVSEGTLIYIRSGVYYFVADEEQTISFAACNFDFTRKFGGLIHPCPALPEDRFDAGEVLERELFEDSDFFSDTICLNDADAGQLIDRIIREYSESSRWSDEICASILRELLFRVMKTIEMRKMPQVKRQAEELLGYIHGHYSEPLSNKRLAEKFSYHPNYVAALVRSATGLPAHRYLIAYRMKRAKLLLETTGLSVKEVGTQVGFPEVKAFSRCFINVVGMTPSEYRANLRK